MCKPGEPCNTDVSSERLDALVRNASGISSKLYPMLHVFAQQPPEAVFASLLMGARAMVENRRPEATDEQVEETFVSLAKMSFEAVKKGLDLFNKVNPAIEAGRVSEGDVREALKAGRDPLDLLKEVGGDNA